MAKRIYLLAENAFKADLTTDLKGGGERYFCDFINLLKQNGYKTYIYQFSYEKKSVIWRGHKINGLGNIPTTGNPINGFQKGIEEFYKEAQGADGIFLLSMNLAYHVPHRDAKILSVSHGIMFNYFGKASHIDPIPYLNNYKRWVRNTDRFISVDTDSIHLMSVYAPELVEKMVYVPNYVDLELFKPNHSEEKRPFRILYPRRLDMARGYRVMMASANMLLDKYKDIEIIFAGKGNPAETKELYDWMAQRNDSRIKHLVYEPNDMPDAYKDIDVAIIPTLYSEGTSLSLLESIACGVVPIATYVGGLSDLIQNNFTGIQVPTGNPVALVHAIEHAMENPEHMSWMRENGQRMIQCFSKERWEKQILTVVENVWGKPE